LPNTALRFHPAGEQAQARSRPEQQRLARTSRESPARYLCSSPKGQLTLIQLRLGITDGRVTEVLSGDLKEGQPVIIGLAAPRGSTPRRDILPVQVPLAVRSYNQALIETEALRHSYRDGDALVWAVDGIDLAIESGEFVAVTGPSGSGKSTFLYLMGCLAKPTSGSYKLDGIDVSGLERNALAAIRNRKLGFVFQNLNLLARMSAFENIQVPLL
jgi:ABC-type glutathione transport system ATPase component